MGKGVVKKADGSLGCTCMHCRRKEFGKAYYMYQYTMITDMAKEICNLINNGVPMGHISDKGLSGSLACLEYNFDEELMLIYDKRDTAETENFENTLKEWQLLDNFNRIVKETRKLLDKSDDSLRARIQAGANPETHLENIKIMEYLKR